MKSLFDFTNGCVADSSAKQIDYILIDPEAQVSRVKYSYINVYTPGSDSRTADNYIYQNRKVNGTFTDLQRAARYLYLIKCSFGSNRNSFATAPKTIYNIVSELPKYKERLKSVIIENRDFEDLIKTYDRDSALFYVDPPYVASERYYNRNYTKFNKDDHIRLNAVLKGIKGRFILSYNDCDFIRDLYKGYHIKCVSRQNLLPATAENRAEFKEVIITNY